MYRVKRIITKRRIFTVSIILVIFVMSLGYATLSQYIELDGMASIDRSWIVKITNVTSTVTNNATSISSNYVSNTVTLNANLPTSSSSVTYTITLSNQGNIKAKLNQIDVIEEGNTNITYEITGVTEEATTLNPGETNTAKVTIKYKDGVTNISETKKDIMITFIYVEDKTTTPSGGSSGEEQEEYDVYKVGYSVTLVDGSKWYVTKNSGSSEDKVTLVSVNTAGSNGSVLTNGTYTKAFDSNNTNEYDQFDSNNIGYFVKNTVENYIKSSINNSGGNSTGTTARLLTKEEYDKLTSNEVPSWMSGTYWLMSNENGSNGYYFNGTSLVSTSSLTSSYRIRPVITTLKSNILPAYLKDQILEDNIAQIDTDIDFSQTSEEDGTSGLYYTSTNTENNEVTYYFRGAVENNYVYFASFYWRIVRINEDESIRLIYQGEETEFIDGIGYSKFNEGFDDNAYVGYMYGTPGSSTYEATHANTNDSTIKTVIDAWYESNLINYKEYLADTGFCGDRSIDADELGYSDNFTDYKAYHRLTVEYQPQFVCPQSNDLYTTASSNKGNKALDYPIGLITADEDVYAGGQMILKYIGSPVTGVNYSYYLRINGNGYWSMTPLFYSDGSSKVWNVQDINPNVYVERIVRPVINLNSNVELAEGNGTSSNPYIVKTN